MAARNAAKCEIKRFRASKREMARWMRAGRQRDMDFSEFVRFSLDTVSGTPPEKPQSKKPPEE